MQPLKPNPFRGLKPYEVQDKNLYGRDKDLFLMKDRVFSARTTLLFAGSGVGKTSFINAKIIPDLKAQYGIIYHKEWSMEDPLLALINTVADHSRRAGIEPPPVNPDVTGSLLDQVRAFTQPPAEGEKRTHNKRCLLILDQFEEVFKYHSYEAYFLHFIEELAELINSDCNVRVLFCMREEFLGELSVFDNKIPDLFSNYYRLKSPNREEAEEIIENTSSVPTAPANLKLLVHELTRIDVADLAKGDGASEDETVERDIVAPPFLQIACQHLWNRQFAASNGNKAGDPNYSNDDPFLTDYKAGDGHRMLKSYCYKIFDSFSHPERDLLADAFDFLVTKKGAKMAYELPTLAEHMEVKEGALQSVLHELSKDEKRILRESRAPDGTFWYELYHDMYGPIIHEWKRAYRSQKKIDWKRRIKRAAAVGIVVLLIGLGVIYALNRLKEYERTLSDANLQDPVSYAASKTAFEKLGRIWGFKNRAKELWADAWKRRAYLAEKNENGDEALLSWLTAANEAPRDQQAELLSQASSYLKTDDYDSLEASYQLETNGPSPAFSPVFSADGKKLLTISRDTQISFWDTTSYQLKGQSPPLDLGGSITRDSPPDSPRSDFGQTSPPTDGRSPFETRIQAAAGNYIGGVHDDKFCIWSAHTGEKIWCSQGEDASTELSDVGYGEPGRFYFLPSIKFSPNGQYFTTFDFTDTLRLYKINANKVELLSQDLIASADSAQFSPDNKTLLIVLKNNTIQLRNLDNFALEELKVSSNSIRQVTFSPDGSNFLVASLDKPPEIWHTATRSLVTQINTATGRLGEYRFCNGETVAIIDSYLTMLTVRFFNIVTKSFVGTRAFMFDSFGDYFVNSDGSSILITTSSGLARLLRLTPTPGSNRQIKDPSGIFLTGLSNNGQIIATIDQNVLPKSWSANDSTLITSFQVSNSDRVPLHFSHIPEVNQARDQLFVSSTGKYICLRRSGGRFTVWDTQQSRQILAVESGKPGFGSAISFSDNDEVVGIAGPGKVITLWQDLSGPHPEVRSLSLADPVSRMQLSPDGRYLAAIFDYSNTPVKVFDVATGAEKVPGEKLTANIAFSNNSTLIATTASENALLIWNIETNTSRKLTHNNTVSALTISLDGQRALTSTSDGTLRLWDTSTGNQIAEGKCSANINQLRLSEDGNTAIAFSTDWIHVFSIGQTLEYVDGRMIGARGFPRILDQTGKNLRRIFPASSSVLDIEDISFPQPNAPTPSENAAELLEKWKQKFSLTLDDLGQLTRNQS